MDWAKDGSLYVGETNRGWGSAGEKNEGLERVIWTGKIPFEMKEVKSTPDGFEIIFTKEADITTLKDLNNYNGNSFIYKYFPVYGSPPIKKEDLIIEGVKPSADGLSVRIIISNLKKYHIHELDLSGIKDKEGNELLHSTTFYTLNNIAEGAKIASNEMIRTKTVKKEIIANKSPIKKDVKKSNKVASVSTSTATTVSYEDVKPLLKKYTCVACHAEGKKQVGPSYKDISKRNYSNDKIVQLIWKPNPANWPTYSTEMAPMPQVKKEDGLKIASWINSLK
jgi:cytochrome c551/c552